MIVALACVCYTPIVLLFFDDRSLNQDCVKLKISLNILDI